MPDEAYIETNPRNFVSPRGARGLRLCLLGATNVGKSSLFNQILMRNTSAVSPKYGTTYDKLEGYFTDIEKRVQLEVVDTPGAMKASKRFYNKVLKT